mmetsp:Transcript_3419/g.10536  ORF Transcript_3419/g.10536 Transcript_3419/m.10536 type:complete len:227 (+) Transcript_3419:345-1025(+)
MWHPTTRPSRAGPAAALGRIWRTWPASRAPCRRHRRGVASTSTHASPSPAVTRRTARSTGRRSTRRSPKSPNSGTTGCRRRPPAAWTAARPRATRRTRVGAAALWGTASPLGTSSYMRASGSGPWSASWTPTTSQSSRARPAPRPARRPASWASTRSPWRSRRRSWPSSSTASPRAGSGRSPRSSAPAAAWPSWARGPRAWPRRSSSTARATWCASSSARTAAGAS